MDFRRSGTHITDADTFDVFTPQGNDVEFAAGRFQERMNVYCDNRFVSNGER